MQEHQGGGKGERKGPGGSKRKGPGGGKGDRKRKGERKGPGGGKPRPYILCSLISRCRVGRKCFGYMGFRGQVPPHAKSLRSHSGGQGGAYWQEFLRGVFVSLRELYLVL